MKRSTGSLFIAAVLAVLSIVQMDAAAAAQNTAPAAGQDVQTRQQFAHEILLEMANFLAGLERIGVVARGGYDAVQADGQKIEFMDSQRVTVVRPGQLRVDMTREDGNTTMVLFDGAQMTVWDQTAGVYAQAPQPGSVDDAYVYFVRDLGMRLPLGSLLLQRLPEELNQRALSVEYVEFVPAPMFAVDAQHIVVRTEVAEVQLWIADDLDAPWPLRVVITYPDQPGQPRYWAEFADWTERPKVSKSHFVFRPPAAAERIVFGVQVLPMNEAALTNAVAPAEEQ